MRIKEKIVEDVAILIFLGDLVGEPETTKVRDKVYSLIAEDINKVIIDLGDVAYVNSAGLGCLISVLTSLRNANGDLKLARIGKKVKSIFVITQLVKVFDTHETVERALAGYRKK
ncbi:MAG: STAS domain-containing protein [Bacteroidetes bacterium]|nr:STAS domain-containing protein [Bacteroidota bacterium]MBU1422814.1 STAS domain-containing protein [Bacteroidota bacterium]MBU2471802.1 STAS domain-containing protein [Bacteroidota bacterium]